MTRETAERLYVLANGAGHELWEALQEKTAAKTAFIESAKSKLLSIECTLREEVKDELQNCEDQEEQTGTTAVG